jgi:hypothetical protein
MPRMTEVASTMVRRGLVAFALVTGSLALAQAPASAAPVETAVSVDPVVLQKAEYAGYRRYRRVRSFHTHPYRWRRVFYRHRRYRPYRFYYRHRHYYVRHAHRYGRW